MRLYRFSYLLLLMLVFSACTTYKVEKSVTANIHLDSLVTIPPSQKVEGMIKPYRDKVNTDMTEVLCLSSEAFYGGRPESPLTNYCADLTLEEANRFCAVKYPKIKMDVSMINRGGLRIPLPKGEIKTMTMFELMPFENEIVFLKLNGEVMQQFINHLAARGGEGVSGLRFGIRGDKAVQPEIGGKPLDTAQSYWLVTSDYIANGGDGNGNTVKIIRTDRYRDQGKRYVYSVFQKNRKRRQNCNSKKKMGGSTMQNRRTFIKKLGTGSLSIFVLSGPMQAFAKSDLKQLTILHTNDFHSHIDPFPKDAARNAGEGGMAKRAAMIQQIRAEQKNVLVFDAGDIFQGTPYFNYYKGELELKLMTEMGYDAATIGNHDLDNGLEGLNSQLKNAGFPFINSNYDFSETILAGKIIPYKIFKKQGIKIGVYGLGIELDGLVGKQNYGKTKYLDPLDTALRMEKFLKEEKNADLIVCLSHLGYAYKEKKSAIWISPLRPFIPI